MWDQRSSLQQAIENEMCAGRIMYVCNINKTVKKHKRKKRCYLF